MGWFGKKEKVPEVEATLAFPNGSPGSNGPIPELPSFSKKSKNDALSREIVKSAVSDETDPGENEVKDSEGEEGLIPPKPSEHPHEAMDHDIGSPVLFPETKSSRDRSSKKDEDDEPLMKLEKKKHTGPIFVRLDKFQDSQKLFEEIKEKISKIEETLENLDDVRKKETEEIESWASELDNVKSKLAKVDSEIFEQV